jgi:hypothetical protein
MTRISYRWRMRRHPVDSTADPPDEILSLVVHSSPMWLGRCQAGLVIELGGRVCATWVGTGNKKSGVDDRAVWLLPPERLIDTDALSAAVADQLVITYSIRQYLRQGCTVQTPIKLRSSSRLSAGEAWMLAPLTATTPACSRLAIAASTSAGVRRSARYIRSRFRPRTRPTTSRTTKYSVLCIGAKASPIACGAGRTELDVSPPAWELYTVEVYPVE